MSSGLAPDPEAGLRKRSVVAIDKSVNGQGRRSTIAVEDLGLADRALAEQFGYKPVRPSKTVFVSRA